jgi:predicted TPR repeat methyltransferase
MLGALTPMRQHNCVSALVFRGVELPIDDQKLARAYNRGLAHEKAGRADLAAKAWRECMMLDPQDAGGASVRLASLGLGPEPDGAPAAYVTTLFDQHADVFDDILVEALGYAVPLMVPDRLSALGHSKFSRMLDIGCGTGLTGLAMRDRVGVIAGADLSEAILAVADERGCYDDLYVAEAQAFLEEWDEEAFDLITATDVLPYLGSLERLARGLAAASTQGAVVVLSSETLPAAAFGDKGWRVGPHQRFHHSPLYIERVLGGSGFSTLECSEIIVRTDEGVPQPGHLVIARKT